MSLVNTAVTAIVALLQASPAVAPVVGRVRMRPMAQSGTTQVVVRPVDTQVQEASITSGYPITWDTRLGVECYARAAVGQAPDVAVDALVAAVYARLMLDPSLGGAVNVLQPQALSYDFDADGENTACATFVFSARQQSVGNNF